jgi:PEGA domain
VSFLNHEPKETDSGAGKFVLLALIVLAALGGVTYWFLRQAPPPPVVTETAPPVVEEAPEPEPEEPAPATPTADVPTVGSLHVGSSVDGAIVFLDGDRVGEAPFTTESISVGRHAIRVEKEGYEPFATEVRIRGGRREELTARLDLLAPSLSIVSDVPGATVFLDRNYVGTTPVDVKDVAPGEHQLTVSADGFDMHAETLNVAPGHRDVHVNFKNLQLEETLAVVHKHRMGSCEGTLIADNDGLRYETSNKNDAFQVPFANLEQFEIDYIEKNLNLKIRKGRNYNFTEKSGNADALFVFHKNVQAFMERL